MVFELQNGHTGIIVVETYPDLAGYPLLKGEVKECTLVFFSLMPGAEYPAGGERFNSPELTLTTPLLKEEGLKQEEKFKTSKPQRQHPTLS
jgi:hypothetical protein